MSLRHAAGIAVLLAVVPGCTCGSPGDAPRPAGTDPAARDGGSSPNTTAQPPVAPAGHSSASSGKPPPDGKYERVVVDGITVPMIQVMDGGSVVLVDTDGQKPRTWEEQYKRKGNLPVGSYDVHKTNANKNETFEDDAIDREGLWTLDEKGNLTRR
jgi:hypothetical protein